MQAASSPALRFPGCQSRLELHDVAERVKRRARIRAGRGHGANSNRMGVRALGIGGQRGNGMGVRTAGGGVESGDVSRMSMRVGSGGPAPPVRVQDLSLVAARINDNIPVRIGGGGANGHIPAEGEGVGRVRMGV